MNTAANGDVTHLCFAGSIHRSLFYLPVHFVADKEDLLFQLKRGTSFFLAELFFANCSCPWF